MNDRAAKDVLDFTFEELEKAVYEKSNELAKEENKTQKSSLKETGQVNLNEEECHDNAASSDDEDKKFFISIGIDMIY